MTWPRIKFKNSEILFSAVIIFLFAATFALAQNNTLASGKNPDFDNNGIVGYSDFFIFADNWQQTVTTDNAKLDLNDDNKINLDDFFVFADYFGKKINIATSKNFCKEVLAGWNDVADTSRINIVMTAINMNPSSFIEKIRVAIGETGDGFFSYEPLKSNKSKFNLWYVDEFVTIPGFSMTNFDKEGGESAEYKAADARVKKCALPNDIHIAIINQDQYFFSFAVEGLIFLYNDADEKRFARILAHEFGHSFASLSDEYINSSFTTSYTLRSAFITENCDLVSKTSACGKWCVGPPAPLQNLQNTACNATNYESCQQLGSLCKWIEIDSKIGEISGCVNIVNICTSFTNQSNCNNAGKPGWFRGLCIWVPIKDPYYNSQCIPSASLDINIGTQCRGDTGCYQGCTFINWYRSSPRSIMKESFSPSPQRAEFDHLNSSLICNRIKELTGSAIGICTTKYGIK